MKTIDLSRYDGRIYNINTQVGGKFCLRFNSLPYSFHYVSVENLKLAYDAGFEVVYPVKSYSSGSGRMEHIGYDYETSPEVVQEFLSYLRRQQATMYLLRNHDGGPDDKPEFEAYTLEDYNAEFGTIYTSIQDAIDSDPEYLFSEEEVKEWLSEFQEE